MESPQRIVDLLKNADNPPRFNTGVAADLRSLEAHNAGRCLHTAKHRPWLVHAVIIEFSDEARALRLEKYLNTGSGVAFAIRHLREATPRMSKERLVNPSDCVEVATLDPRATAHEIEQRSHPVTGGT